MLLLFQTCLPLPLGLRKPEIERKQLIDMNCGLILGSHGDTIGVLPAEVLRRRTAGKTLLGKMCFRQSGTVSDEKYRAVQLTEVFGEILQRDGPVFT